MEVYINDMLIKSRSLEDHSANLEENILVMKHNKVRINLAKCAFRVLANKFLGFMLTKGGMEAKLVRCRAILKIRSSMIVKEVQRLKGQIVALSRSMSKLVEWC